MKQSPLLETIKREILQSPIKAISFYRFMELCLYHPVWGYYCQDRVRFGKQGDFFTNAQVGDLFGRMLGQYFLQLQSQERIRGRWALIEIGAGDGQLMNTIISFFRAQAVDNVDYYIVEKGNQRQDVDQRVIWVDRLAEIPNNSFAIIYSNEWFDALPVYCLQKNEGEIQEVMIAWDQMKNRWFETCGRISNPALQPYLSGIAEQMEEGQRFEINLDAKRKLQEIADWLTNGYLVTIDYGGETEELLLRKRGTVRYFQKHRLIENTDFQPGEVDITANVNFTWLKEWGEAFGMPTEFYGTQTRFLLQSELLHLVKQEEERNQLKQLIHPYGLGEAFRVLIQRKGKV